MQEIVYDFIGIGLGPFNLSLASLAAPLKGHSSLFMDMSDEFNWHPGMLLNDATMQTPFIADLVTLADPTSPYSFLNYAKESGRLYSFYIREDFFLLRQEYNHYCQWVAKQLPNLRFNQFVELAHYDDKTGCYELLCIDTSNGRQRRYRCKRLVLGQVRILGCLPVAIACVNILFIALTIYRIAKDYGSGKTSPSLAVDKAPPKFITIFYVNDRSISTD